MKRIALVLAVVVAALGLVQPAAAGPSAVADKWAVLVGINDYQGKTVDTVGSVGDVNDMRDTLLRHGWPNDHIVVLTESNATAAKIRAAWRWLADRTTDSTYSVFHYSGHVKQISGDRDGDGEDLDEYLWSVDNRFLSDGEFGAAMRQLRGWAWVNVSGCEAAGFDEGIAAPKRLFTASSQETQKSYEQPRWQNSVFVGYLADIGVLQGHADANGDGRVSITEAFRFSAHNTPQMTRDQRKGVQNPYTSGGDGTEWFLDGPAPAAPAPSSPANEGGDEDERICIGFICFG